MWYRLYELDEGDHILKAITLEFPGDDDAMAEAQARAGVRGIELWQESRRVGRIEPQRPRPTTAPEQNAAP